MLGNFVAKVTGHLRSKIEKKIKNDLLTSLMPDFGICIKFDDEVMKKNRFLGQVAEIWAKTLRPEVKT